MGTITAGVTAAIGEKVPKGVWKTGDDVPDYFHVMLYGETNSYRTTTAAMFGGSDRTLIVSTRAPEQVKIPLRGLGFRGPVLVEDADALIWAIQSPEKAAEFVGFPEWKDQPDRVLMFDDMTEGLALLVDDNSVRDDGREVKDGRQIYGATKADIRAAVNALKRKQMHIVYTALAAESETAIYPDMSTGSRKILLADLEYVFYMKAEKRVMRTFRDNVGYVTKDQFGKDIARSRQLFAKHKVPKEYLDRRAKNPSLPKLIEDEEPMDLAVVWAKIQGTRVTK